MKLSTLALIGLAILAVAISSGSMALAVVQPNIITSSQNYSCNLAPVNQQGDGCLSPQEDNNALEVAPYLDSTSPSNSVICVGYYNPSTGGQCTNITAGNLGSISGGGSYYCISVNTESYSVSISMTCTGYWN